MKRIHDWMPNQSVIDWEKEHRKATFWPWSSAASFKKNRLNRNLIFFLFSRQTRLPFSPQGHCSEQDQSALQWQVNFKSRNIIKWLNTLHLGPAIVKLAEIRQCAAPAHTATQSSSSRPSHQLLVALTAAAFRCRLIKHHCNAELLGGLAKYADEVLHKNPITDWTQQIPEVAWLRPSD